MRKFFIVLGLLLALSFATVVVIVGCDDDDDDDTLDDDLLDDDFADDDNADDDIADDDVVDDDVVDDDVVDDDVVDDDVVDDDVVDDDVVDDDVVDDDAVDDDSTVNHEDFINDDGSVEAGLTGGAANCIVAATFEPINHPSTLTEVSVYIVNTTGWDNLFRIVVLADEMNEGPDYAYTAYQSVPLQATSAGWYVHDLTAEDSAPILDGGSWIVGLKNLAADGPYVGVDEFTNLPFSYFFDADTTSWYTFYELAIDGIAVFRGRATY